VSRRAPAALVLLLAVVALLGVGWALLVPAWQAPDENSHFAYVQSLAERGDLPGDARRELASTEQRRADRAVDADSTVAQLQAKPTWSRQAYDRWRRAAGGRRDDGGGTNPAASDPPLYYLYDTLFYDAASGGNVFTRLLVMRLGSVLLLLVTVAAAWAAAGEAFGRDRALQLGAAGVVGLLPMMTFLSASVTPDALVFASWTVAVWLGLRILRRGLAVPDAVGLLLTAAVAVLAKSLSYALLPGVLWVLAVGVWGLRPAARIRGATAIAVAVAAFALPVGGWVVATRLLDRPLDAQVSHATADLGSVNLRGLASYVWQFYLPRPGFMTPNQSLRAAHGLPLWSVWIKTGFAAFGWLEVTFPDWVYGLLTAIALLALLAAALALRRRRPPWPGLVFAVLLVVPLLAGLHWTEYRLAPGSGPFLQGRQLLPLVGMVGLVAGQALWLVRPGRRGVAVATLLGGLLAFQVASLALVLTRFYAP
jgi:hypothetical protein